MQTKTPSELNRDGVLAIVWLPLAEAQYFNTLQPIRHVKRALLLMFPECASLLFPHRPSAQSDCLIQSLTEYAYNFSSASRACTLTQNSFVDH